MKLTQRDESQRGFRGPGGRQNIWWASAQCCCRATTQASGPTGLRAAAGRNKKEEGTTNHCSLAVISPSHHRGTCMLPTGFETMLMNPSHHHVQHRCVHLQGQAAAANVSHTRVCASKCGFLLSERLARLCWRPRSDRAFNKYSINYYVKINEY